MVKMTCEMRGLLVPTTADLSPVEGFHERSMVVLRFSVCQSLRFAQPRPHRLPSSSSFPFSFPSGSPPLSARCCAFQLPISLDGLSHETESGKWTGLQRTTK